MALDCDFDSPFRDGSPLFFIRSQNLMQATSVLPRAKGLLYYCGVLIASPGPNIARHQRANYSSAENKSFESSRLFLRDFSASSQSGYEQESKALLRIRPVQLRCCG